MAKAYLERLETLMRPLIAGLPDDIAVEIKHFFSGAAAYANGHICVTLTPVGLALKLPEAARGRLRSMGGQALRYFPKGPVKKDYVVVPPSLHDDGDARAEWIGQALAHAAGQAPRTDPSQDPNPSPRDP